MRRLYSEGRSERRCGRDRDHQQAHSRQLQLTKVDKNYPDHHLNGAVFEVYRDGKLVGQMEELSDGVYKLDDLPTAITR